MDVKVKANVAKAFKKLPTKSAQIRYLNGQSFSRSEIASILSKHYGKEVRYQHVRNVLITPIQNERK